MIHQPLTQLLGFNVYPLYLFGIPTFIFAALSGGIQRTLSGAGAKCWCFFGIWLLLATPFSFWRGGSWALIKNYMRADFPMLLAVAGLVLTWKECITVMRVIALSAMSYVLTAHFFQSETRFRDRLGLQFGSMANPNDLAAHLLLLLPFLLWFAGSFKFWPFRIPPSLAVIAGFVFVLQTASRGAVVGIAAGALYYLWQASPGRKAALIAAAAVGVLAFPLVLSQQVMTRLKSFSPGETTVDESAIASQVNRKYLFLKSLEYTAKFPIFGVGPGQFSSYEGRNSTMPGSERGAWEEAHCTFTQISSETGLPGFFFFAAGIVITFRLIWKTMRQAKQRGDCPDIERACSCILLALVTFYVAISFVNFAYFFYEPALAGLAIAVSRAAKHEFSLRDLKAAGGSSPAGAVRGRGPALRSFAQTAT